MSRSVRVTFLGNDRWSVPALEALAASDHVVVAVVTAVPRPAGRGNRLRATPVADAARRVGSPLFEVETVKRGPGLDALRASDADVLAVVAYGEILPSEVLETPSIAPVNLHFSLLPLLRGASPVQAALLEGHEETGVTTIVMDAGMDTGPVLLQRTEAIAPDDDAGSLGDRLASAGARLLVETVDALATGSLEPRAQDETRATFTRKLGPGDRKLRWSAPARDLVNLCRAMSPEPGATTRFRGETLKVFRADTVGLDPHGRDGTDTPDGPGTVVAVGKDGFVVATATDGFAPLELAPAGRRRMHVRDFVNGHRPRVGERLT